MFALAEWLHRNAARRSDAPALIVGGATLAWRELLAAPPPVYAAALAGRPWFPLDPGLPAARRAALERLAPGGAELLVATSGSTGAPKAVMLSGANLRAHVAAARARLGLEPGDLWLDCLPLFHVGGLMILWRCAEAGAAVVLHDGFDAERVLADLRARPVTHLSLVPTMLARLLDLGGPPPPALRVCLVGGAALPGALAERALAAGWPLSPTYGMSEAASQVATLAAAAPGWRPGSVGRPLSGFEVDLRGGRVRVRGPAVMLGYANAEGRPGDGLDDGWYETGDLGAWDDDGGLVVLGRADDMVITGGENVHPLAVEEVAARCPGVAAVAIAGRPDALWGEVLVAAVVGAVADDAFLGWCRERLPPHMRPRQVIRLAALPLLANGKPDRRALRRLVSAPAPAG